MSRLVDRTERAGTATSYRRQLLQYSVGFGLSIGLTLVAYSFASGGLFSGQSLLLAIGALAVIQALVQLILFLHLLEEAEPRWKLLVFDFMLLVVVILVFGTLWIMNNLMYNMTNASPAAGQGGKEGSNGITDQGFFGR